MLFTMFCHAKIHLLFGLFVSIFLASLPISYGHLPPPTPPNFESIPTDPLRDGLDAIKASHDDIRRCAKLRKLEKLAALGLDKMPHTETIIGDKPNDMQQERLVQGTEKIELELQFLRRNITLTRLCMADIESQQGQQSGVIGSRESMRCLLAQRCIKS
jgi:hypothetical protein